METVLVEISNQKAYKLLEDLEALHILKVLKKSIEPSMTDPKEKKPTDFFGTLDIKEAEKMHEHVLQSRSEWGRGF